MVRGPQRCPDLDLRMRCDTCGRFYLDNVDGRFIAGLVIERNFCGCNRSRILYAGVVKKKSVF